MARKLLVNLVGALVVCILLLFSTNAAAGTIYAIDFKVANTANYGALQFSVNYSAAPGVIGGEGAGAWCTVNSGLNAAGSLWNADPNLEVAVIKTSDMTFPAVVVTCYFDSTGAAPVANNFSITLVDWSSDTTSTPPILIISSISAL